MALIFSRSSRTISQICSRISLRSMAMTTTTTTTNVSSSPMSLSSETAPLSSLSALPSNAEMEQLVQRICSLDLLQTAQLVGLLRERLNLPDIVSAPVAAASTPATTSAQTAATTTAKEEKTEFRVTLEKFDAACKAKVIKEIKALMPQMNLVEAKAFVEGAPKLVKEKVKKEEAEKLKKALEDAGATVTLD